MPIEFNTVIHRYSIQSGVVPTAAELYPGELALNLADGKLFTLNPAGTVIDLTGINSQFNLTGSLDGDLLVYNSTTGRYEATRAKDVLDGGSY
jgi:hypothetical protein